MPVVHMVYQWFNASKGILKWFENKGFRVHPFLKKRKITVWTNVWEVGSWEHIFSQFAVLGFSQDNYEVDKKEYLFTG